MPILVQSTSRPSTAYLRVARAACSVPVSQTYRHPPACRHVRRPAFHNTVRASSSASSSSSLPDDITRPLKRSPYRLLPLPTFLASFAPLHVAGWRLVTLSPTQDDTSSNIERLEKGIGTLEGKKMVRAYAFPKDVYGDAMILVQRIGQAVQEENHHPIITICPASDYANPSSLPLSDDKSEHIVEIITHTHTPLPESKAAGGEARKPGPGVTGKDLKLAERIESAWDEVQAGMQT